MNEWCVPVCVSFPDVVVLNKPHNVVFFVSLFSFFSDRVKSCGVRMNKNRVVSTSKTFWRSKIVGRSSKWILNFSLEFDSISMGTLDLFLFSIHAWNWWWRKERKMARRSGMIAGISKRNFLFISCNMMYKIRAPITINRQINGDQACCKKRCNESIPFKACCFFSGHFSWTLFLSSIPIKAGSGVPLNVFAPVCACIFEEMKETRMAMPATFYFTLFSVSRSVFV